MWRQKFLLVLGCLLQTQSSNSWMCTQNSDCESTVGAYCNDGNCVCPLGQQSVLGGTLCADASPYLSSTCLEDYQCSRLITNFECRKDGDRAEGNCFCREGFHYLHGRCWQSADYDSPCLRDENCIGRLRDPYSLACDQTTGTCQCASGYYRRQRGECRKIAYGVNEACVLDEDCQFTNGACNINTFRCYDSSAVTGNSESRQNISTSTMLNLKMESDQNGGITQRLNSTQNGVSTRQSGVACDLVNTCPAPFICSDIGTCICPVGYYPSQDGSICLAELGSPSTAEQCTGLFAEVRDGICTCQVNFYFEEDMRDCVKVARLMTDSCLTDNMCHTFGVAVRCLEGEDPLYLRNCECIPEMAVWDEARNMCRLFVGVGEFCEVSSDCLAGELEIECVPNDEGDRVCTCPEGTSEVNGLCLTSGLQLGDSCQASSECTETANNVCDQGRCSCTTGYQEVDEFCVPTIGGACAEDSDCLGDYMVCVTDEQTNTATCRCGANLVEYQDECWPSLTAIDDECMVTVQCAAIMGEHSFCQNNTCLCLDGYHQREGGCWQQIGLFEGCTRSSECYLGELTDRVVCRNSLCQCAFEHPYSEELQTCSSSASTTMASLLTILVLLFFQDYII